VRSAQDFNDSTVIFAAYAHRAARVIYELETAKRSGVAWHDLQVESSRVSRAYCQYIIAYCVARYLSSKSFNDLSSSTQIVMRRLMTLYHLYTLDNNMGDFTEDGFVSASQVTLIRQEIRSLLRVIRPDAVGLAESYGWPDFLLNSALGSSDGRAYERMVESLLNDPLNNSEMQDGVIRSYHDCIRPLIKGEVGVWKEPNNPTTNQSKL
jgi:acyl-CoA oxidase